MSIKVMTMVWDGFPDSGSSLLCMLALADWCDDNGGSLFPSMAAVAEKVRVSTDQARRIMNDFKERGFLKVEANAYGGKPGTTPHYRLNVPALRKLALEAERRKEEGGPLAPMPPLAPMQPLAPVQGEGLHGCKGRAGTGARLTTKEPPINRQSPHSPPEGGDGRFEDFWSFYPRKVGKDAARRAFAKRNVDDMLLAKMLDALETQKRSPEWKKDGGQFIPHPSTWLNQGRWQDELPAGGATAGDSGGDYRDEDPNAWGAATAAQRAAKAGMPAWNNVEASMGRMPDFDSYKRQIHARLTQQRAA